VAYRGLGAANCGLEAASRGLGVANHGTAGQFGRRGGGGRTPVAAACGLQPRLANPTSQLAVVRSGPGGRSAPGAANRAYCAARTGLGAVGRRRRPVGAPGGGPSGGGLGLSQRGRSAGERKGEGGG
jgi:hypothetical protein